MYSTLTDQLQIIQQVRTFSKDKVDLELKACYDYCMNVMKDNSKSFYFASQQLAEEQTGFLARTYYYKALAAAYITEEKALIDQLTTKTEQTYKSHPAFPIF